MLSDIIGVLQLRSELYASFIGLLGGFVFRMNPLNWSKPITLPPYLNILFSSKEIPFNGKDPTTQISEIFGHFHNLMLHCIDTSVLSSNST
jgi:hypothetical protein